MGDERHEQKRLLRRRFAAVRGALTRETAARLSALASDRLAGAAAFRDAASVGAYAAVHGELDPSDAVAAASRAGAAVYFPVVRDDGIEFHAVGSGLRSGWRGIPEPEVGAVWRPDGRPSVILVPGLAFDVRGGRLGRGGGHYDRALAAQPDSVRVGLAYELQIVEQVPAEAWDVPMHYVVTEARVIAVGAASDKENRA